MQRDRFSCRECGDAESTLNVHHKLYRKGYLPWEYRDDELITLCAECHSSEEQAKLDLLKAIGSAEPCSPMSDLARAIENINARDAWKIWDWMRLAEHPDLLEEFKIRAGNIAGYPIIGTEAQFYGYIVALWIGKNSEFYARFEYHEPSQIWRVPDAELFGILSHHLNSMAETRYESSGEDFGYDKLWIEKKEGRWLVYLP